MQTFKSYPLLLLLITLFFSCKKNDTDAPVAESHDVFVVGTSSGKYIASVATLWKNSKRSSLWLDTFLCTSIAAAITVADTNVYIAGATTADELGGSKATYWVNGVVNRVTNASFLGSYATAMAFSGGNVYMTGAGPYLATTAALSWKNLAPAGLTNSGGSVGYGIGISGGDILVAGDIPGSGALVTTAYLWKNGMGTQLATKFPYSSSHAAALFVAGNDVYITGDEVDTYGAGFASYATYWKNGIANHIGVLDSNRVSAIFVAGNDVYLSGVKIKDNDFVATYWKNGVPVYISDEKFSQANTIYVLGNDVYTAGYIVVGGNTVAVYWKNKTVNPLNGTKAYGIFVK